MQELEQLIINQLDLMQKWYELVPGSDWIKTHCTSPEHDDSKPSAGINKESGILHCFACNYNTLFVTVGETGEENEADVLWKAKYQNYKKQLIPEYPDYDTIHETLLDRNKELFVPRVSYMLTEEWRGLSPELLADAKSYYCSTGKYRGRFIFPLIHRGQQYGFDARVVDATANMVGAKWVRNRGAPVKDLVYPMDVLTKRFPELDHVLVVEGVADALSYIQMGVPAIASFGLSPPSKRRIEELIRLGVTKITIAFDNDKAGREGMVAVLPDYAEWFEIVGHPLATLIRTSGFNDANEFLVTTLNKGFTADKTYNDEEV